MALWRLTEMVRRRYVDSLRELQYCTAKGIAGSSAFASAQSSAPGAGAVQGPCELWRSCTAHCSDPALRAGGQVNWKAIHHSRSLRTGLPLHWDASIFVVQVCPPQGDQLA